MEQEFQDWDLVIVDDASQDNTVALVEQYCQRDSRLQLVVNEQNLGLTRNWNRCLELATGPLVQIMQSDDLVDPDYLGLAATVFSENPGLGLVASSCRYIDADDQVIHPGHPRPPRLYEAGDDAVTALVTGGWPHVSSIVFRRECYERLGGVNERIWHGPDGEFFTRLASRYAFYHFGEVHTSFRRHGSNMGVLEYLRDDFLEVDLYKKRLAWSYLSPPGRTRAGVEDLDQYIAQDGARTALGGVLLMVAYGRPALGRFYFRQALKLDNRCWRTRLFWKAAALLLVPSAGKRVMQQRMQIRDVDQPVVEAVADSLLTLGTGGG
jgi:glycosyltransferase involved in cell wall biosynthesis